MKPFRFLSLAILAALVGCSALAFAQDDKQQEDKPAKQEEPKPEPKKDEAKPSKKDMQNQDKQDKDKEDMKKQSNERNMPEGQEHPEQPKAQGQHQGKGGHIPDDKFRSHFGHGHTFTAKTVIVQGRPQFNYGGYNFELVDAWPADWAYTDECYIDFIDGEYFLFDLAHPGVRIAVFVVM